MVDIRSLGGNGIDVDFLDATKYEIPAKSESPSGPAYDVVQAQVRGSVEINLGLSDATHRERSFEVWITAPSWQEALDNYNAIRAQLKAAGDYSMYATGNQCTYSESAGNQGSATVRNVKRGQVQELRDKWLLAMNRIVIRLTLTMEPDSAD